MFFIDINDFRGFVDRHGASAGDQLLVTIAQRLKSGIHDQATAARLGGDEFALVCEGVPDSTEVAKIAKRIATVVGAPVQIGADEFTTGVSVGVALGTAAMLQPATLLRHAEVAMYRARRGQLHYDIYKKRRRSRSTSDIPPHS